MLKSDPNPQKGDLVRSRLQTEATTPWVVIDFFPWGCGGKHAWAIQNTLDGSRRVVFRTDIDWWEPKGGRRE